MGACSTKKSLEELVNPSLLSVSRNFIIISKTLRSGTYKSGSDTIGVIAKIFLYHRQAVCLKILFGEIKTLHSKNSNGHSMNMSQDRQSGRFLMVLWWMKSSTHPFSMISHALTDPLFGSEIE